MTAQEERTKGAILRGGLLKIAAWPELTTGAPSAISFFFFFKFI